MHVQLQVETCEGTFAFSSVTCNLPFLVRRRFYPISVAVKESHTIGDPPRGAFSRALRVSPSNHHLSVHVVMDLNDTSLPLQFWVCPYNEIPLSASFVYMTSSNWEICLPGQQRTNRTIHFEDSTLGR